MKFKIKAEPNDARKDGLDKIKMFLDEKGSTNIQECINTAVLELLDKIVFYPVEDENKYTNKKDRMLPDAYLS